MKMPFRKTLVGEGCEDPRGIYHRGQAAGILKIHTNCEPPCRRKQAAQEYLRLHPAPDTSS